MAHRRIGQEGFRFGARAARQTSLDELGALIDWPLAAQVLSSLHRAAQGEKARPSLAMFKAPCLPLEYGVSDVALAEALCDRASFRRFCGFARDEATPERTAGVALPAPACRAGARRGLFAAIARDLEAKGATVRKGTSPQSLAAIASLIDATIIGSASTGDKEAAWGTARARPRMATRPTLRPPRIAASSATSRRPRPMSPMSQSLLRSSPKSRRLCRQSP
jgi:transposase, IS5 family